MLYVLDEFARGTLSNRLRRRMSSRDVIEVLTDPSLLRGFPA
jgi:hypothetical protein